MKRFFRWLKEQFIWYTNKKVLQMINDGVRYDYIQEYVEMVADGYTVKVQFPECDYYITRKTHKFIIYAWDCLYDDIEDLCTFVRILCVDTGRTFEH